MFCFHFHTFCALLCSWFVLKALGDKSQAVKRAWLAPVVRLVSEEGGECTPAAAWHLSLARHLNTQGLAGPWRQLLSSTSSLSLLNNCPLKWGIPCTHPKIPDNLIFLRACTSDARDSGHAAWESSGLQLVWNINILVQRTGTSLLITAHKHVLSLP